MTELFIAIGLFWVVCGVFAYGLTFAHFQRKYPSIAHECEPSDRRFATILALSGPVGLITALWAGSPRKYGLRYR